MQRCFCGGKVGGHDDLSSTHQWTHRGDDITPAERCHSPDPRRGSNHRHALVESKKHAITLSSACGLDAVLPPAGSELPCFYFPSKDTQGRKTTPTRLCHKPLTWSPLNLDQQSTRRRFAHHAVR
ncbi:hypothetical protein SKAU_G00041970 [Synaphobranchus kaupii]|uniref:Uncharacterized protein n=1 Tax=Synaphobranchus kaupii TaxID=118154 RepID=A0A9Q1G299_SYNKA|nr:hypothetical protein SKAU_G00041970 [Synaphobranchus kaupii]